MNRARPAAVGSLCDVPGISVGHATDVVGLTGCTVVLCESGAVAGVDVRGAAPGTRETDLLRPESTVEQVHAILLTGGSAFGLDAASGVMRYLEERSAGFPVRTGVVPIVPAAVIFDLGVGDSRARPDATMGYAACDAAVTSSPDEGRVGAGTGATFGKMRGAEQARWGGIGTASVTVRGRTVAALVVVNAVGYVVDDAGQAVDSEPVHAPVEPLDVDLGLRDDETGPYGNDLGAVRDDAGPRGGENTTIGVVATDLPLDTAGVTRLAQAAHDGLARAIWPAHTAFDGDTFFALSTAPDQPRLWPIPLDVTSAASDIVEIAIRRAVRAARGSTVPGRATPDRGLLQPGDAP